MGNKAQLVQPLMGSIVFILLMHYNINIRGDISTSRLLRFYNDS